MVKDKPLKLILWPVVFAFTLMLSLAIGEFKPSTQANADVNANAYDISEYQGYINDNQASQLKNEVNFMILKAENGGLRADPQFNHNASEMSSHNIPYGAYDYSLYANPAQAQAEAQALYQRAPQASFYVNDSEENDAGSQFNQSTQAWANEIHQLTTKSAVLYSGNSFINNNFTPQTLNSYDAIWDAAYGPEPSSSANAVNYMPYHYDLWQNSDDYYSPALGQQVDSDVFPNGANKPLSFWTGNGHYANVVKHTTRRHHRHVNNKHVLKPRRSHTRRNRHAVIKPAPVKPNKTVNKRRGRKARKAKNSYVKPIARRTRKSRRNNPASKRIRKPRRAHQKRARIVYNRNFYRSKRIHYLKVTDPNGIHLFNMNNQYEDGVAPGTILNVYGFKTLYDPYWGYYTEAIGRHFGKGDLFTAQKDLVQWV